MSPAVHPSPPLVRRVPHALGVALVAALVLACVRPPASPPPPPAAAERTVVLVSLDGFRADDFARFPTPVLHRLAARGARAERMIPSFPSKTFPNHFAIVTGKRPEHNGIVANEMVDPHDGATFSMSDRRARADPRWWVAEPVWVTAERRGIRTAPIYWPGSEAPIGGIAPAFSAAFDVETTAEQRVRQVIDLLALPPSRRPRFATVYLQDVDDVGHDFGPTSAEAGAAVARVDAAVGTLEAALERLGLTANTDLVIVADHGMADTPAGHAIYLDDLVDLDRVEPWITSWSPVLGITPPATEIERTLGTLRGKNPHLTVYRRDEVPARLHYRDSERIPPIVALADEGWSITTHRPKKWSLGSHGYDPALPSMGALFIAAGPDFPRSLVVSPFENVEVYPMLCVALGLQPLAGDWTTDGLPAVLRAWASRR